LRRVEDVEAAVDPDRREHEQRDQRYGEHQDELRTKAQVAEHPSPIASVPIPEPVIGALVSFLE
jgi:hypothetical protein